MSTLRANTLANVAGTGSPDIVGGELSRARFNLNGTGTIAARDSYNVSSFVDNGVGDYTANFGVAMPTADYEFSYLGISSGNTFIMSSNTTSILAASIRPGIILSWNATGGSGATAADFTVVTASVHGDKP